MADQQYYNSFADRKALEDELRYIEDIFRKVKAGIKELNELGIKIDSSRSVPEAVENLKKQEKVTDELTLATKEYNKTLSNKAILEARLNATNSDAGKGLADRKVKQQELNRELKTEAQIMNSLTGSIDNLEARRAKLTQKRDKIQPIDEASIKQIEQFNKRIDNLNTIIERMQDKLSKRRINVGNYEGSAKIIVDAFERARIRVDSVSKSMGPLSPEAAAARREFEGLSRIVDNPQFLNVAAKFGDATAETRFFTKALIDLEQQGLKDSRVYKDIQTQLTQLTDTIRDTRQEIKALSSDTRGFDLFAGAVSAVTSSFQVAAGAAKLFGGENKDTQQAILKLVAIQNVANGVRAIANDLTSKGTFLQRAYALVQGQVAIMLNSSAAAATRLTAALKLTGIGLLITGIGYLISKLGIFSSTTSDAEKEVKKLNLALERQNRLLADNASNIDNKTKLLLLKMKEQGKSEDAITAAQILGLAKLRDQYDKTARKRLSTIQQELRANNLLVNNYEDAQNALEIIQARYLNTELGNSEIVKATLKDVADNFKTSEDYKDQIAIIYQERQTERSNKLREKQKEDAEDAIELAKKEAEAAAELNKFKLQLAIEQETVTSENDALGTSSMRIQSLKNIAELEKQIIRDQLQYELSLEDVTLSKRKLLREAAANDISLIESRLGIRIAQIRVKEKDDIKNDAKEALLFVAEQEKAKLEVKQAASLKALEKDTNLADLQLANDKKLAQENFKSGLTTKEQYLKRLEEIEIDHQSRILSSQILYYKTQIDLLEAMGIDTLAMRTALANAEAVLANLRVKKDIDQKEVERKLIEETKNNYIDAFQQIADAYLSIIGGAFDAQKNKIQEQIDEIERLKNAEIEAINASGDSAEKKAARIKVVEARAQAEREALEKRQRQIDRQKAVAERGFKAFQILTDNIQAVNKIRQLILTAPDPITKGLYVSQLVLSIASGAAALTSLLATPIPKFAKGTENAPRGLAIVGEEGRELIIRNGQAFLTPDQPTLTQLMGSEKILPNRVTEDMMRAVKLPVSSNFGDNGKGDELMMQYYTDRVVNAIKKIPAPSITIIENQSWHEYIEKQVRR